MSNLSFNLYCLYIINYFFHLTARVPVLGSLRLTALTFVACSAVIFLNKMNSKSGSEKEPINKALFVFLVYIALSLPLVEFPGSVINKNASDFIRALAFFYFTILVIDTKEKFNKVIFIIIFSQVFRVLEPLYMNLTTGYWGGTTYMGGGEFANRLGGSPYDIINSNELAFVIVTIIPFVYYYLFENQKKLKIKLLALFIFLALSYALVLTLSRGGLLIFVVCLWLILKDTKYKYLLLISAFFAGLLTFNSMSFYQKERVLSIVGMSSMEGVNSTSSGRINGMLNEIIIGLKTNPVVGHGVGTTGEAKYHYDGKFQASHNFYAELIIETGLIGFILFMLFIRAVSKKLKELKTTVPESRFIKTARVVFIVYLIYSINYFGLSQYYWYLFAGLIVAFSRIFKVENEEIKMTKAPHFR